jgi:membrane fusion protein (multidrug efflux system)
MKTGWKLWVVVILGLVLVVGLLVGVKAAQIVTMVRAAEAQKPPPMAVSSATAELVEWAPKRSAVATLVAVRGVTLSAELPGRVTLISFEPGSVVRKGTVLVQLDASTEQAQLQAAQADASLAKTTLERVRTLRREDSAPQSDLDAAQARARGTAAAVATLETTIAKKTIRAPFDGRISIRQVELGQVVAAGTPIASLQSVTPIHADFWMPQQALAELRSGQKAQLKTDPFPNAHWDGEITTVNPEVDTATRNVRIRATFPNADGRLRPGLFANVEVASGEPRKVLQIPATAVIYAPYGDSVYALAEKDDGKGGKSLVAQQKFVRLGERRGDYVAVVSGLEPGERIVGSGGFKLRNGVQVAVNDALAPGAELSPRPSEQ